MSLDGIWSIEVASIEGWARAGIVLINKDKVAGGSRNYYAVGSVQVSGSDIKITLNSHIFGETTPLFGTKKKHYSLIMDGKLKKDKIKGALSEADNIDFNIPCHLTRRADLP